MGLSCNSIAVLYAWCPHSKSTGRAHPTVAPPPRPGASRGRTKDDLQQNSIGNAPPPPALRLWLAPGPAHCCIAVLYDLPGRLRDNDDCDGCVCFGQKRNRDTSHKRRHLTPPPNLSLSGHEACRDMCVCLCVCILQENMDRSANHPCYQAHGQKVWQSDQLGVSQPACMTACTSACLPACLSEKTRTAARLQRQGRLDHDERRGCKHKGARWRYILGGGIPGCYQSSLCRRHDPLPRIAPCVSLAGLCSAGRSSSVAVSWHP